MKNALRSSGRESVGEEWERGGVSDVEGGTDRKKSDLSVAGSSDYSRRRRRCSGSSSSTQGRSEPSPKVTAMAMMLTIQRHSRRYRWRGYDNGGGRETGWSARLYLDFSFCSAWGGSAEGSVWILRACVPSSPAVCARACPRSALHPYHGIPTHLVQGENLLHPFPLVLRRVLGLEFGELGLWVVEGRSDGVASLGDTWENVGESKVGKQVSEGEAKGRSSGGRTVMYCIWRERLAGHQWAR